MSQPPRRCGASLCWAALLLLAAGPGCGGPAPEPDMRAGPECLPDGLPSEEFDFMQLLEVDGEFTLATGGNGAMAWRAVAADLSVTRATAGILGVVLEPRVLLALPLEDGLSLRIITPQVVSYAEARPFPLDETPARTTQIRGLPGVPEKAVLESVVVVYGVLYVIWAAADGAGNVAAGLGVLDDEDQIVPRGDPFYEGPEPPLRRDGSRFGLGWDRELARFRVVWEGDEPMSLDVGEDGQPYAKSVSTAPVGAIELPNGYLAGWAGDCFSLYPRSDTSPACLDFLSINFERTGAPTAFLDSQNRLWLADGLESLIAIRRSAPIEEGTQVTFEPESVTSTAMPLCD